jgi:hypothetical protein
VSWADDQQVQRRHWLQIADGHVLLPSDEDISCGSHSYTVAPYQPAGAAAGLPSQAELKRDYLRQMSKLLPRSTRLAPESRSAASLAAPAGPGKDTSENAVLLEHIRFLHEHVSSLTVNMEQLQQQLALTQLINKQLVSITEHQKATDGKK